MQNECLQRKSWQVNFTHSTMTRKGEVPGDGGLERGKKEWRSGIITTHLGDANGTVQWFDAKKQKKENLPFRMVERRINQKKERGKR